MSRPHPQTARLIARLGAAFAAALLLVALILSPLPRLSGSGDSPLSDTGAVMTALGPAELCGEAPDGAGHPAEAGHCPDCLPLVKLALVVGVPPGPALPLVREGAGRWPGGAARQPAARLALCPPSRAPPSFLI